MNTLRSRCAGWVALFAAGLGAGCDSRPAERPATKAALPEAKKVLIGPNVFLETQGARRRVIVSAEVVQQKAALEFFLCRKGTKDHESIAAADVDARDIHKALLLANAEPGSPVRYEPKYRAPTGQPIRVSVQYEKDGKQIVEAAQSWVRNVKTGQTLASDWVFAGSRLMDDPLDKDKPKIYLANDGELICVSNFEEAMLDLPVQSSKDNADLSFETFAERVPPIGTKLAILLEPMVVARGAVQ